jgi:hypothetical protein
MRLRFFGFLPGATHIPGVLRTPRAEKAQLLNVKNM